jgi:plasmid stabilization system protein ParE
MNYRLIIRPEAELDLEDAFAWYESQDPGLGSEFVRAIDACVSTIGRNRERVTFAMSINTQATFRD